MRLTERVVNELVERAWGSRPEECCGIVLAEPGDPGLGARLLPSDNIAPSDPRRNYRLDYRVHLRAIEAEGESGAVILAYYHSHPEGPARPSRLDAALACPGIAYLILGLVPRLELRAWRCGGERFDEETVQIVREREP